MSLKPTCQCHDHSWNSSVFFDGQSAISRVALGIGYFNQFERYCPDVALPERANPHQWHVDLQQRFTLHPVVEAMLVHRPGNWQSLLLEWPHVSEKDPAQLAYTRDEAKGTANVQTVTSIGKYVARHWPHVADHVRRDACALFTPDKLMLLPATSDEIVRSIQAGPKSCMQGNFSVHPYKVYDPSMGWAAAVRTGTTGRIDGRALTWTDPDDEDNKGFVRTYARCFNQHGDEDYSSADQTLAAWLESEGFEHWSGWPDGTPMAHIEHRGRVVLPYIDGDNDYVQTCSFNSARCLRICDESDANYRGENQGGYAEDVNGHNIIGDCEDCGETVYEGDDDYIRAGRYGDRLVCSCCSDDYRYVEGASSRGHEVDYYVQNEDALEVNGNYYDRENAPDKIVQLEDGDYINTDQDDYCEIDNEYYLTDDERVVCCEDGEYRLKGDCWQCAHTDEWYSDDEDYEMADGKKYHPDALEELRDEQQVSPLFTEMATA